MFLGWGLNPDRGIAEISVVQVTPTSVRLSITGKEALPEIKVAIGTDGLTFSATPALVANDEIDINVIGKRKGGYLVPNAATATGNVPIDRIITEPSDRVTNRSLGSVITSNIASIPIGKLKMPFAIHPPSMIMA